MSGNFNFIDNFDSIDESQFNKLILKNDAPFIQYPFLKALENSGCVGRDLGWTPKHLVKSNKNVLSGHNSKEIIIVAIIRRKLL